MKKNEFAHTRAFLLIVGMIMLLSLSACNTPAGNNTQKPEEKKYTIWRDETTYAQYQKVFVGEGYALKDGYTHWFEFDVATWKALSNRLGDNGKYIWTESQVKDWIKNNGLKDETVAKISEWLAKVEHGLIASRTGNNVNLLIK